MTSKIEIQGFDAQLEHFQDQKIRSVDFFIVVFELVQKLLRIVKSTFLVDTAEIAYLLWGSVGDILNLQPDFLQGCC